MAGTDDLAIMAIGVLISVDRSGSCGLVSSKPSVECGVLFRESDRTIKRADEEKDPTAKKSDGRKSATPPFEPQRLSKTHHHPPPPPSNRLQMAQQQQPQPQPQQLAFSLQVRVIEARNLAAKDISGGFDSQFFYGCACVFQSDS